MSKYFAKIDENNVVRTVVVASSKEWCEENLGGAWVETFMDDPGKTYAGKGAAYDTENDDFILAEE